MMDGMRKNVYGSGWETTFFERDGNGDVRVFRHSDVASPILHHQTSQAEFTVPFDHLMSYVLDDPQRVLQYFEELSEDRLVDWIRRSRERG